MTDAKLLVFDLDGTLIDTFQDIAAAVNHAMRALGRPQYDLAEVKRHVGHGGRRLIADLLGDAADEAEIDRGFELWRAYYADHTTDYARPYDGVLDGLDALRAAGYRTAILSNKTHSLVEHIAKALDLTPRVDLVRGELPPLRKPDPAVLRNLVDDMGADLARTEMIGDGDADAGVARKAGVPFQAVAWGVNSPERLHALGAENVFESFAELLAYYAESY